MKNASRLLCAALLVTSSVHSGYCKEMQGPKKRIAVKTFQDKSGSSWHHGSDVGDGMADMLTTALQKTGKFIVVERSQLSDIRDEQELAKEGSVQAPTGASSGKLIGAAYIVTGSVTEFGIKDSKFGAGNLGTLLPIGGSAALMTQTARVALDLRFIDTTTGQVITTEKAEGTNTSRKIESDLDKTPSLEIGKEGFDDTVIGKATREAIEKAVKLVEKNMEKTPWIGRVVKVQGNDIFLNTGEEDGRKPGDVFQIVRAGETMMDPDTGETLGSQSTIQGQVRIVTVVGKRLSKAEIVKGTDIKPLDSIQ